MQKIKESLTTKLTTILTKRNTKKLANNDFAAMQELKPYQTQAEVDLFYRKFLYKHKHEMTKSEVELFTKLINLMKKQAAGVANIYQKNLADYTGQSVRTVNRNISRLKEKGAIAAVNADKIVDGRRQGNGNCYYVLLPEAIEGVLLPEEKAAEDRLLAAMEAALLASEAAGEKEAILDNGVAAGVAGLAQQVGNANAGGSKDEAPKKAADKGLSLPKLLTDQKDYKTIVPTAEEKLLLEVPHFVGSKFKGYAASFLKTAKDIQTAWKVIRSKCQYRYDLLEDFAMQCISAFYVKAKEGATDLDNWGYLDGIAKNIYDEITLQERLELFAEMDAEAGRDIEDISKPADLPEGGLFYDWLNDRETGKEPAIGSYAY